MKGELKELADIFFRRHPELLLQGKRFKKKDYIAIDMDFTKFALAHNALKTAKLYKN